MMRMTCELPDHARVVEALLEGFVRAAQVIIESGLAPADPRTAGVKYKLEPPGEEDWKLPHNVLRDGWGDCEDIAGWRAAGLRATGEDTGAVVKVAKTGKDKLHAVVQRSDGSFEDPCKEMWLNQPEGQQHVKRILGAPNPADVFKNLKPGQIVAPNGTVVDTSTLQPAIIRDHRPGASSRQGTAPTGQTIINAYDDDQSRRAYLDKYANDPNAKKVQTPYGTNWVKGRSAPSIDPNTGEPYLVNPITGQTTPYGQQNYGLPPGYAGMDPYAQYGYGQYPYGYGMDPYSQYGYNQYGYSQWAPESWFWNTQDPSYGGGGFQADGTWVDPRAVALFAQQAADDSGEYF